MVYKQFANEVVADSSYRILQERCGKVTVSCRKTPEIAGTWKQYSGRKLCGFFRWIPANFLCFLKGTGRKSSEKNPAGMLLPCPAISGVILPEPALIS
jgi:hypothetical protein